MLTTDPRLTGHARAARRRQLPPLKDGTQDPVGPAQRQADRLLQRSVRRFASSPTAPALRARSSLFTTTTLTTRLPLFPFLEWVTAGKAAVKALLGPEYGKLKKAPKVESEEAAYQLLNSIIPWSVLHLPNLHAEREGTGR